MLKLATVPPITFLGNELEIVDSAIDLGVILDS